MVRNDDKIDFIHFTFWLLKDISWFLNFKLVASFLAIPTILITIYVIYKSDNIISTSTIFSCWVMMNILWMFHELHGISIHFAEGFIFLSLFSLVMYYFKYLLDKRYEENIRRKFKILFGRIF